MKYYKLLSVTLASAVLLCGCGANNTGNNTGGMPEQVLVTPTVDESGLVDFIAECQMSYCSLNFSERGGIVDYPFNAYAEREHIVWYSPTELSVAKAENLFDGDVDEESVKNACEFLSALYFTSMYSDTEQMRKNLEARYGLINSELSDHLRAREDELIEKLMTKNTLLELQPINRKYRFRSQEELLTLTAPDGKIYSGIVLKTNLIIRGKDFDSLINDYAVSSDYDLTNFKYLDSETACAYFSDPRLVIVFGEDGKLCAWGELFGRFSDTAPSRYFAAGKNGIERGEEKLRVPVVTDPSLRYSEHITLSPNGKKAQQTGISCYTDILSLNGSSDEHYFDVLYEKCSDELKAALRSSGILDEMLADAKKYNISFTLDPKSQSAVSKEATGLDVYRNTEYGDVYVVDRICYLKTGSSEFNKKYGLPEEKRRATFKFFVADENGTEKLIGFIIKSNLLGDEYFKDLDQVWQGNWDNG